MTVSLMSFGFLAVCAWAVVTLTFLRGPLRHLAFLAANLAFCGGLLLGGKATVLAAGFSLLGFLLTLLIRRWPERGFWPALATYTALFVYLRNYDFLGWVLPRSMLSEGLVTVGLSFMFFKIVHVMIETRSDTIGSVSFPQYFNYTLNFTAYMMGPIQRFQDFREQWTGQKASIDEGFEAHLDAGIRILMGLVKAYLLAAVIEPFALADGPDLLTGSAGKLLLSIYAFYFYLYLNFSGYCDVVIGVGALMGVRPPENFDKPFLARNISDFWSRFHRSLTQWLTDFVFSPAYKWALSKPLTAKRPLLAMNGALLLTMLVSGLWHGTTLSFLLFGLAHGLYFVTFRTSEALFSRRYGKAKLRAFRKSKLVTVSSIFVTLSFVALSLVFFRLDAGRAFAVLGRLVGL